MKGRKTADSLGDAIMEEDEDNLSRPSSFYNEKLPVDRTKSTKDPEGLTERDI